VGCVAPIRPAPQELGGPLGPRPALIPPSCPGEGPGGPPRLVNPGTCCGLPRHLGTGKRRGLCPHGRGRHRFSGGDSPCWTGRARPADNGAGGGTSGAQAELLEPATGSGGRPRSAGFQHWPLFFPARILFRRRRKRSTPGTTWRGSSRTTGNTATMPAPIFFHLRRRADACRSRLYCLLSSNVGSPRLRSFVKGSGIEGPKRVSGGEGALVAAGYMEKVFPSTPMSVARV